MTLTPMQSMALCQREAEATKRAEGIATIAPCRMTWADYRALDAVNQSTIKHLRESPLHYRHAVDDPDAPTDAMNLGSGTHTAVFEPDSLILEYAVFAGKVRRGKEWEAFEAANEGRTILTLSQYETACRIRDTVRGHPLASHYLERGRAEQSLTWVDPATGLLCKARVDWIAEEFGTFLDLKTTRTVDARLFGQQSLALGWHLQAALYRQGLREHGLDLVPRLLAVESKAPHDVGVFVVGSDPLYAAEEQLKELLGRIVECRASGLWPGRYTEEQPLDLPPWAYPDDDAADGLGLSFGEGA